jgi:hypothetical protein
VRFTFDGEDLVLTSASTRLRVPTKGHWPGEARIESRLLKILVRGGLSLPGEQALRGTNDRVRIGNYSVTCTWLADGVAR